MGPPSTLEQCNALFFSMLQHLGRPLGAGQNCSGVARSEPQMPPGRLQGQTATPRIVARRRLGTGQAPVKTHMPTPSGLRKARDDKGAASWHGKIHLFRSAHQQPGRHGRSPVPSAKDRTRCPLARAAGRIPAQETDL